MRTKNVFLALISPLLAASAHADSTVVEGKLIYGINQRSSAPVTSCRLVREDLGDRIQLTFASNPESEISAVFELPKAQLPLSGATNFVDEAGRRVRYIDSSLVIERRIAPTPRTPERVLKLLFLTDASLESVARAELFRADITSAGARRNAVELQCEF